MLGSAQEVVRGGNEIHDDSRDQIISDTRRLEQLLEQARSAGASARARRLREAQQATRQLGQQMTAEQTCSYEQARSRERIVAQVRQLESLLAAAASGMADAAERPSGGTEVINPVKHRH
jgi:hypothetical protein